ncbi:MAG TPA: S-layer homology domain-containing protein [Thermoanaerobaculia bacterium]|nr:S-layer homology domain-containing protein [Thermoanaerobaculia bacterium]
MRSSRFRLRASGLLPVALLAVFAGFAQMLLGLCGPFTDVAADVFCPFVLEIFYLGITTGTSATTYDPTSNVSRLQMAAFLSRTVDGVLKRGSRRAALDQFWTTQNATVLGLTTVGTAPTFVACDGADVWVSNLFASTVSRVRGSDGRLLETWSGAVNASGVIAAMGRIIVGGNTAPNGSLYQIDPSQTAGAVTTVASNLGSQPIGITFDGSRIWTANSVGNSVSIVTPTSTAPWTVTTVTTGFSSPNGILYDGANIWVTDEIANALFKLNSSGAILQTVTVGVNPFHSVFDGGNIWVPNSSDSVSVVRVSTGAILQTLTGNGLNGPKTAAFDGQRVLITNTVGASVSLWKAADLTPIGVFSTGTGNSPFGAASDGVNFWITLEGAAQLARF